MHTYKHAKTQIHPYTPAQVSLRTAVPSETQVVIYYCLQDTSAQFWENVGSTLCLSHAIIKMLHSWSGTD